MDHGFSVKILDEALPMTVENGPSLIEKIKTHSEPVRIMRTLGHICRYFNIYEIDPSETELTEDGRRIRLNPSLRQTIQMCFVGNLEIMKGVSREKQDYPLENHDGVYVGFWPSKINCNEGERLLFSFDTSEKQKRYLFIGDAIDRQFSVWGIDKNNVQPQFIADEYRESEYGFDRLMGRA